MPVGSGNTLIRFSIAKLQRKFGNAKGNVEKNNFECAKIAEIFGE